MLPLFSVPALDFRVVLISHRPPFEVLAHFLIVFARSYLRMRAQVGDNSPGSACAVCVRVCVCIYKAPLVSTSSWTSRGRRCHPGRRLCRPFYPRPVCAKNQLNALRKAVPPFVISAFGCRHAYCTHLHPFLQLRTRHYFFRQTCLESLFVYLYRSSPHKVGQGLLFTCVFRDKHTWKNCECISQQVCSVAKHFFFSPALRRFSEQSSSKRCGIKYALQFY